MHSLKLTAKARENGWLGDDPFHFVLFILGRAAYFQGLLLEKVTHHLEDHPS